MAKDRTKKKKEAEKDPDKKEYSVIGNILYITKGMAKTQKVLLILLFVYAVSSSSMSFIWTFITKFVIDFIQASLESTAQPDTGPLIQLILITTGIEFIAMAINSYAQGQMWWRFIACRFDFIQRRIEKALKMDYQLLETPKVLDYMQKAMNATGGNNQGVEGLMHNTGALLIAAVKVVTASAIIFVLNPLLILAALALCVAQFLFFDYTRKKDKRETWDEMAPVWRKINYMTNTTSDFSYAKDIRLFSMKHWLGKRQHEIYADKHRHMSRSRDFWLYNSTFAHGVQIAQECILYSYLVWCVICNGLSIGDFTLYIGAIRTFSSTVTETLNSLAGLRDNSRQVNDFRTFVEYPDSDGNKGKPLELLESYNFEFRNVSFKYAGQEKYALKNLNLVINQGERLAVVGLNGAGKTTFIKLLLRLYDVTEGEILLNGVNIKEYDRGDYYRIFAPVFQNVEIFAFPLCENVSMDTPENTDKKKTEECLELAGFTEKLKSLPDGVDTELLKVIHDDGVDLSGGEKQKLALARALYKNAPFVVLDEPTAVLDALAEYKLYMDFDKLIGSKSAVYISHRLSSTRFCDHIAMFEAGEMVEYGTHKELLAKEGKYAEMFEVQAQYYCDNGAHTSDDIRYDPEMEAQIKEVLANAK